MISNDEFNYALARSYFFHYCHLLAGDFYKYDREFLIDLCETLQDFLNNDSRIMIINMPPRHGKSRTIQLFVSWLLGNDPTRQIMTGSYNAELSTELSMKTRNIIDTEKVEGGDIVFNDIFPNVRLKHGEASKKKWTVEGGTQSYMATSPNASSTGFGANIIVIDDLVKSSEDAHNIRNLDKQWAWFTETMLSRLERGQGSSKIIIVMTRWHSQDIAGRLLKQAPRLGIPIEHVDYKWLNEDEEGNQYALCEEILPLSSLDAELAFVPKEIIQANYQQEPIDLKGSLYANFKIYEEMPDFRRISAYIDTADTGSDYLCAIVYGETKDRQGYILDVLYTQEPMEITEPAVAEMLYRNGVNVAHIESNNGGRGFARNVERILKEYNGSKTRVKWFTQTKNKDARIYSQSAWVMGNIYFPEWIEREQSEFWLALISYQAQGKNRHDDAPDALTGVAEKIQNAERNEWRGLA